MSAPMNTPVRPIPALRRQQTGGGKSQQGTSDLIQLKQFQHSCTTVCGMGNTFMYESTNRHRKGCVYIEGPGCVYC